MAGFSFFAGRWYYLGMEMQQPDSPDPLLGCQKPLVNAMIEIGEDEEMMIERDSFCCSLVLALRL